jgi:hypothetical protein
VGSASAARRSPLASQLVSPPFINNPPILSI